MTATATSKYRMTAAEAWLEVETRQIHLTYTFNALWHASVDIKGERHNSKRNVRSVSVIDLTAFGAVERLCAKLDNE